MTYRIVYSTKFKKALKKCFKRGLDVEKLREVLRILEKEGVLPPVYRPHKLSGKYKETGNVTFSPTGFWSGSSETKS